MNKTYKNYIYNLLYQGFVIILPLITAPYLARTLGAEMLGVSSFVTTVSSIFTTFGMVGLYNYSVRQIAYVKDNPQSVSNVILELYIVRLLLCIVTCVLYSIYFINSDYSTYFIIQFMYVLAFFIDPCWIFIGMENMGAAVLRNFFMKFFTVVLIFLLIETADDIVKYVFILSFMTLLASAIVLPQIKKYVKKPKLLNFNFVAKHLKASLLLFLPQVATLVYLQVDKVMIEMLSDSISNVAFYDQGEKIVKMPLTFITVLSTVMMPRIAHSFAQKNMEKIEEDINKVIKFSAFLAFPMMFGVMGLASDLIPWYLGIDFFLVSWVIIVLSPIIVVIAFSGVSGTQYFTATNQTKILTIAYSIAAVVNLIINFILIPQIGVIGAALGTLCAEVVSFIGQYYILKKQINLKDAFKTSIVYFIKSIPLCVVVFAIGFIMPSKPITTVLQITSGALVYLITLIITKDKFLYQILNLVKVKLLGK